MPKQSPMTQFIKSSFPVLKDIGIVFFIILAMWGNARYVSNDKFDTYNKANDAAHIALNVTMASIDKSLALQQQNNQMLMENANQIKVNTVKLAEVEIRITALERTRGIK